MVADSIRYDVDNNLVSPAIYQVFACYVIRIEIKTRNSIHKFNTCQVQLYHFDVDCYNNLFYIL